MPKRNSAKKQPEVINLVEHLPQKTASVDVDTHLFANNAALKEKRTVIALDLIQERTNDTRPLNQSHVQELKESIAAVGLLQPPVLDNQNRLLAGAHRLAALRLLQQEQSELFVQQFPDSLIPVRIMSFDGEEEPERALECEVAENEKRRDYTASEVRALAERLRAAGYKDSRGKPKKGEKPLGPALQVIVGKNLRTIQRYLSAQNEISVNTTAVVFTNEINQLRKIHKALKAWQKISDQSEKLSQPKCQELAKKMPGFLKLIEAAQAELDDTSE